MNRTPRPTHKKARALALALTGLLLADPAAAQVSLAVGYARVPDHIGAEGSDGGAAARVGFYLGPGRTVSLGLEFGLDRLNEAFHQSGPVDCLLPGGTTGDCYFSTRERDTGLALSGIARFQIRSSGAAPYFLAGLGVLNTRTRSIQEATDASGGHLPNFEFDGTFTDTNLMAHLGAGIATPLGGGGPAVTLEGRLSPVLYNYSGAPSVAGALSLLVGVRWPR